jgi:signal transduction histidine kinase/CheY-like chemotaxis protein
VYERVIQPTSEGGWVITHTDITERKKVEADLREQREVLQDVFDNVAQGLAAYDGEARVITWNRKYQEYLILSDEQIYPGCPVWNLVMLHAERGTYGAGDRAYLEEQVRRRIDKLMSGEIVRFDYVNAEGIEMEAISVPRPKGGFVVTYADITDRKKAEAEIIRARDEAEAANRAKSAFLAAMSHEIRTPMNGVLGMIEVLQHSNLTADQRMLADTVSESATALLRILDDILDFSKIEAGRMELEAVAVPLRRTLDATLDTVASAAEAKGLDLTLEMVGDLPPAVIGDPVRLRQVLLNLLGNAVKFTEAGAVRVRVDGTPEGGNRTLVRFAVNDTGIGMTTEQQQALFQPFSQAESTTTRRFGGTGLGLSICRRLVELMGGDIGVDSEVDKGSTFHFSIPFDHAEPSADEAEVLPDLTGLSVVIVRDRDALIQMLRRCLASRGVRSVVTTLPGTVSKVLARVDGPVLVLTDDRVPVSEPAALKRALAQLPSVLIRAAGATLFSRDLAATFSATVNRPLHRASLYQSVTKALERQADAVVAEVEAAPPEPEPAKTPRVLVADDNAINRFVVERQLTGLGYVADYADDGQQAFEMWRGGDYDLLLVDCQMPKVDGYEFTRMVRAAEAESGAARTPIVALTANAMAGEEAKCLAAGMDGFLTKPAKYELMRDTLATWIGR